MDVDFLTLENMSGKYEWKIWRFFQTDLFLLIFTTCLKRIQALYIRNTLIFFFPSHPHVWIFLESIDTGNSSLSNKFSHV